VFGYTVTATVFRKNLRERVFLFPPADHPKMTDERLASLLASIVRAAMRGVMEAVLEAERPLVAAPPPYPERVSGPDPERDEIPFPSVTAAEETLFGETPPPTLNEMAFIGDFPPGDLDVAVAALAKARAQQEQEARPAVQGGPGEKDVAEWLRLPQA